MAPLTPAQLHEYALILLSGSGKVIAIIVQSMLYGASRRVRPILIAQIFAGLYTCLFSIAYWMMLQVFTRILSAFCFVSLTALLFVPVERKGS